jgi:uncharacterized protein
VRSSEVLTSAGPARLLRHTPKGAGAAPVLVLGHGAGGGVEAADLQRLATVVIRAGFRVALVEQPWRVAGRRLAPRPEALDAAWIEVLKAVRLRGPLVLGGRSAGARVACRTAGQLGAAGGVCLAYPLHPPGSPERSRADELRGAGVPTVVVQGSRDPFGTASEVRAAAPGVQVLEVVGGDHGLARADIGPALDEVVAFLGRLAE